MELGSSSPRRASRMHCEAASPGDPYQHSRGTLREACPLLGMPQGPAAGRLPIPRPGSCAELKSAAGRRPEPARRYDADRDMTRAPALDPGTRRRVLLVEDDERVGRQVLAQLRTAGFLASWARDGREALRADPQQFGLVILDLMLPGLHGLDVLKSIRSRSEVPVLVLSARNETEDKVRALGIGADDFLTKPFWPEELLARVRARMRRPALGTSGPLCVGPLHVDLAARKARVGTDDVDLTRVEFDLLATLAQRAGQAVSRRALASTLPDPSREGGERNLDVHMSRLRKKLGSARGLVRTVWGIGYRLELGEPE
jgi:DNA-binding response OmpR family regulator